jgi:hypothetical protein
MVSTVNYAARCRNKFQNFFASTCILFSRPLNNKLFSRASREIYRADTGPINISPSVGSLSLSLSLLRALFDAILIIAATHPLTHPALLSRRAAKGFSANHQSGSEIEFHSTLSPPFERTALVCPGICYHKLCSQAISSPLVCTQVIK